MAKREWGAKHTCAECGVKFYDLHRRPIACPRCDSVIEIERVRPTRRRPPPAVEPAPAVGENTAAAAAGDESADEDDAGVVEDIDGDDDGLVENLGEAKPSQPSK